MVRDNGVGLARERAAGLGLVTMRERAELMRARLRIRALPSRGTEVRLTVPVAGERTDERRSASGSRRI